MADLRDEESIGALMTRLVEDAKAFVQAEIVLVRTQVTVRWASAKFALVYGVVALILVHLALIGLVVGLVLTLAAALGPGWATLIVVLGLLLIAGLLGWLAARKVSAAISPEESGA